MRTDTSTRSLPGPGQIELYLLSRQALLPHLDAFRSVLNREEQERMERLLTPAKQIDFTLGRGFLRTVLASYTGEPPENIPLLTGPGGKPGLPDHRAAFNLSHSGAYFLIAAAGRGEVGVDIQEIYPISNPARLAERYFSTVENRRLADLSSEAFRKAFFKGWVRKEAYLKGLGTGLDGPIHQLSIVRRPDQEHYQVIHHQGDPGPSSWTVAQLDAPSGYCAAAALSAPSLTVRNVPGSELIFPG